MIWYYEKHYLDNKVYTIVSSSFKLKDLTRLIDIVHTNKSHYNHLLGFCVSINPMIMINL